MCAFKHAPRERETREPIEIAVAVLDEAVLDLIQDGTAYFDPYEGFYTQDGLDVRNYSLLTRLVGRQKIDLKGANPGGDGGAAFEHALRVQVRELLEPVARARQPRQRHVRVRAAGQPHGLARARDGCDATDRLGLGQTTFKVNLPTEVRPVMPNQVTEGDRFDAAFGVMNRTDKPRDIRVTIAAQGNVTAPVSHTETVHLEPFARTTVQVPVEAARVTVARDVAAGRIDFTVTARDAADGDGLKHALVVNKRRSLEDGGDLRHVRRRACHGVPAVPRAHSTRRRRRQRGLEPERHRQRRRCVPLSARLPVPLLGAAADERRDGVALHAPARLLAARSRVARRGGACRTQTLAQAASFQAPSGGMTYYVPQDQYVSPYLSAYTALAFAWLRDDGHAIPEAVETKLHEYLDAFLKRDVAPDFYTRGMASTVRAVALAALAKRGKVALADLRALSIARRVHEPVRQGALPASRARDARRRGDRARGGADHPAERACVAAARSRSTRCSTTVICASRPRR